MKKFTFFFSFLWLSLVAFGQVPLGISYQTVIRDGTGQPMLSTAVTLKMTIRTAAPDGVVVYSETHPKTTNTLGLVTLTIGLGTPVEGNFATIDWGAAPHFLETALDATGSGQFQVMGVTQFLSVPYALNSLNGMPPGENPGDMLYWDGSQWMKIAVGQNGQALILQNGIPTWGGVQLPILITSAVTNITAFTAYCGGNIASDGGSPIVGRGICWNTSPNPTTSNFKVFTGSGAGNFLAQMTGLESSTQYFVRAFATNSAGTSYGQEMTFFTTAGAITLSTTAITNITVNSATSGGNITLNGGSPVTARGVCWNTAPYPTLANSKTTDGTGNGTFISQLTGLANNTQYYVRAYATNILGTSYGNQLTFTTLSGIVTLTTAGVTEITDVSAICGGEITSDGGSAVTARGVCWNTSPNPTTANSFTSDGAGTGSFTSNLSGLAEDTIYYIRAYATNTFGTWYGNEVSFETPAWECGSPIVDERDGQTYNTVQIGEQCWMAENLNVGTRIDANLSQQNNGTIEKYCYDNLETNCDIYGGLFQWDEIMEYSTVQGIQGICPEGWHITTDYEWCLLEIEVDPMIDCDQSGWRGTDGGGKLKEVGFLHWANPNTGASNSSGFTALPGGYRDPSGLSRNIHSNAGFWSSSQDGTNHAWYRDVGFNRSEIGRFNDQKAYGFSLRCLMGDAMINQAPISPSNPIPENSSTNNSSTPTLSWSCNDPEGDPLTYDVFFGTENPPSQVATYIADTFYTSGTLNYNTTYYWRIVAHDDHGNSTEGEVWSFTTMDEPWQCGDVLIDERDGQEYNTVQIGEQCWMAENLNVGTRIDGSQNQQNNSTIEKYCFDNLGTNCDAYGGLYQWNEMMLYTTTASIQGICMDGWHLPTDAEWCTLEQEVDQSVICSNIGYIGVDGGGKLKETGTIHWNFPNTGATNSFGFTALPGGDRSTSGSFRLKGHYGNWWSSSQYDANYAWRRYLDYNSAQMNRNYLRNEFGFSVRCLKDN